MRALVPLAALTSLAACTVADDSYPSLLPRPIERRSDADPVRPDPVAAPDPAIDARVAEQRAAAEAVARRFNAAAVAAETRVAVARGLPAGSEPWIRAQTALADLAPIRGEMAAIVATLEEIAIARAAAGEPAYPALDAAIAALGAVSEAQGNRIAALEDALAG